MEKPKYTKEKIDKMVQESIDELFNTRESFSDEEKEKKYVVVASAYVWAKNDEDAIEKGKAVAKAMESVNPQIYVHDASMDKLFERPWGMTPPREINIKGY